MADIINFNDFERRNLENRARNSRRIRAIYASAIQQVTLTASRIRHPDGRVFELARYPALNDKVQRVLNSMQKELYTVIVNGIEEGWKISNDKNNLIVDRRLGKMKPKEGIKKLLYDPNKEGLERFIARKDKGLGLSERVWNTLDPFKHELEQGLGLGIADGKSAAAMAKELKQYLYEPEKLFRRVRGEDGKLRLSKAAREYHPGQGVYRSSFKNALRLSRSENNMAYRTADHERWNSLPFITGFEVKLSASHPRYDICDHLVGSYPKGFKFVGWHTQCICFAVPKFVSDDDYQRIEAAILAGSEPDLRGMGQVSQPPSGFTDYYRDNKDRIAGWKSKPYWVRDNKKYLETAQPAKQPPKKTASVLSPGGQPIATQFSRFDDKIKTAATAALRDIDRVHGDGLMIDIPFQAMRSKSKQGTFGYGSAPRSISLSTGARNSAMTIYHEMGHYLDFHAVAKPGTFASLDADSPVGKVVEKIRDTDLYKELNTISKNRKITLEGQEYRLDSRLRKHVAYLMDPTELWARAYAQFITNRSGNKQAQALMAEHRSLDKVKSFPQQWQDKDFEAVEKAIEKMMLDLGWMVSQ